MGVKVREKPAGSGVWWLFIDHNGQRKAKKVGTDKKLALEAAKKIEAKLTLKEFSINEEKPVIPTYGDYAKLWLETQIKPFRKPTTYERYHGLHRDYILPRFGKTSIDEIKRKDVRGFLSDLLQTKLSHRSVEFIKDVFSGPFNLAIDEEVIPANPCTGVLKRLGVRSDRSGTADVYDREEVAVFLETAKHEEPAFYSLFLTLFRTGVRLGEALALTWKEIDWRGSFFMVKQSFRRGRIDTPKTGKTRRVDMTDQLRETLKAYRVTKQKESMAKGIPASDYVFSERTGQPISQNTLRHAFKRTSRKAGLREIRVHDSRHSYASILISEGTPIAYVKEQLGHASIQMTVDRYAHWIPSGNHMVNILDSQPSATYTQPLKIEKP
ncbi:site-specific integrase [Desulforhabdus sp. TSK]|uniref:tyrosine-type recombinase/integrase n=1 Tax=Desulforhabdus sp. TSK TaxID=2925014 RepID=UPI001FC83BE6|nr:site-specific integrase [Desulforhabdus sp. TSK]GKT10017.1 site-specific integrase [Desulforhabdus sp. TSK]